MFLKAESFTCSEQVPNLSVQSLITKIQLNLQASQISYTKVALQNHLLLHLMEYFCEFGNLDALCSKKTLESSDFDGSNFVAIGHYFLNFEFLKILNSLHLLSLFNFLI